jgi:ABC-type Fe3+ transport system permease subunit
LRTGLLLLVAAAWAIPGPIVGVGLKSAIDRLMDIEDALGLRLVRPLLYDGPSYAPVLWAQVIRLAPFALAVLWPIARLLPPELRDTVRLQGATPSREFTVLIVPLLWPATLLAGLAVAILSLGELAASKLVHTPGAWTFAHELFTRMHYGVTNDVAALALVMLGFVTCGAGVLRGAAWLLRAGPLRSRR